MIKSSFATASLLAVALAGCSEMVGVEEGGTMQVSFDLRQADQAGFHVDKIELTLEHRESGAIQHQLVRPSQNQTANAEVKLVPGQWDVDVELYDGDRLVGAGDGTAVVLQGFVTQMAIDIELATGGLEITVNWSRTFNGPIADVSHNPISVEIEGAGVFSVHGLSRVGWDIQVIATPTRDGRTHKDPGTVTFPDIAMVHLTTRSRAEAQNLVRWIDTIRDERSVSIIGLRGLGGQSARINIYEAVPVDGNASLAEGPDGFTVAGLRVQFRTLELSELQDIQQYPPCPAPGYVIEVSGVTADPGPCYPTAALQPPAIGSSAPLLLPAIRSGADSQALFDWAEAIREEVEEYGCAGCQIGRRSGSVITKNAQFVETGRINFFEGWPSSFTLFNPTRRYGTSYLFDILIQNDFVEDAN